MLPRKKIPYTPPLQEIINNIKWEFFCLGQFTPTHVVQHRVWVVKSWRHCLHLITLLFNAVVRLGVMPMWSNTKHPSYTVLTFSSISELQHAPLPCRAWRPSSENLWFALCHQGTLETIARILFVALSFLVKLLLVFALFDLYLLRDVLAVAKPWL